MKTLILILVIFSSSVFAEVFECVVEKKMSCNESGCEKVQPLNDDYRFVDTDNRTIKIGRDAPSC